MKMTDLEKQEILKFLESRKLMSIGTYYKLPWAACVYFLYDDNFNFYFVSDPETKHCKNISKNPKVSVTVADSNQKASSKKKGFQARGEAKMVNSVLELKNIVKAWNKRHLDTPPINLKTVMKVWKSKFYKVKLNYIQLFDEKMGEDKEYRSWKI